MLSGNHSKLFTCNASNKVYLPLHLWVHLLLQVNLALYCHHCEQTTVALRLMYRVRYLISLMFGQDIPEIATCDVSTGHNHTDTVCSLSRFLPSTLIVPPHLFRSFVSRLSLAYG